tara:strand:- start:2496 stop:2642 length:147 start_codon:yes stop_codon:yes gene_type:complete
MEIRELAEKIIQLVLKSQDDYEATYSVEDEINEYLNNFCACNKCQCKK